MIAATVAFQVRVSADEYAALIAAQPRGSKNSYIRHLIRRNLTGRGFLKNGKVVR